MVIQAQKVTIYVIVGHLLLSGIQCPFEWCGMCWICEERTYNTFKEEMSCTDNCFVYHIVPRDEHDNNTYLHVPCLTHNAVKDCVVDRNESATCDCIINLCAGANCNNRPCMFVAAAMSVLASYSVLSV